MVENFEAFDFALADDDMAELDRLDQGTVAGQAVEEKWWW
jgi:diketogulonate reductase-like aldo/keto reductase